MIIAHIIDKEFVIFNKITNDYDITRKIQNLCFSVFCLGYGVCMAKNKLARGGASVCSDYEERQMVSKNRFLSFDATDSNRLHDEES